MLPLQIREEVRRSFSDSDAQTYIRQLFAGGERLIKALNFDQSERKILARESPTSQPLNWYSFSYAGASIPAFFGMCSPNSDSTFIITRSS